MEPGRACGTLLHPTSLPSLYGVGDLGAEAYNFVDFLAKSGQKLWQVLPLNPVGYGDSPYQCFSAFAGETLLLSPDELVAQGYLSAQDLAHVPFFPAEKTDFAAVRHYKNSLFQKAFSAWKTERHGVEDKSYREYLDKNCFWLHDYALFAAAREHFKKSPWNTWEKGLARREREAVGYYENLLSAGLEYQYFLQYQFEKQWLQLKQYAEKKGIRIIGDLPLFVSADSCDTWTDRALFEMDEEGRPSKVAGVPPDYFSKTGQLWGSPHYRWKVMAENGYLWWRERLKKLLEWVDVIRIDHFRGFEAYWEVPGDAETAVNGRWVKGPGEEFFRVIKESLGKLPVIAEDLGFITDEVIELRNSLGFPGMKVLQFINRESIAPSREDREVVYYTGTHDNDTLVGWYRHTIMAGLNKPYSFSAIREACWELIACVYQSQANWVIIPLQDVMGLDSASRMNTPGTVGGNWQWRFRKEELREDLAERLLCLVKQCHR